MASPRCPVAEITRRRDVLSPTCRIAETTRCRNGPSPICLSPKRHRRNGIAEMASPRCPIPSYDYPFEVTGLDYAGLLFASDVNQKDMNKCYILLFTCTATRAVHLELTPEQGSSTLLLALCRFNSRRGVNKMFISDNFKSFKTKEVLAYLREKRIEWKFILENACVTSYIRINIMLN